jgi:hypothetical protein
MKLRRAVITAAGRDDQQLPLQRLIDRDGLPKTALQIVAEAAAAAGADEFAIVVRPGAEDGYRTAVGTATFRLELVPQRPPWGINPQPRSRAAPICLVRRSPTRRIGAIHWVSSALVGATFTTMRR